MELFDNLALGLADGAHAGEPPLLPDRRRPGHGRRRAARHRADRHDRDAAADHVQLRAGAGADHACRHLLRRPIRRIDDGDPDQPARRVLVRRDGHRRPRDGQQGRAGPALATAALGSFFAGTVATIVLVLFAPAARARRARVRAGRVLLAGRARPDRVDRAGARLDDQGAGDDRAGTAARHGRPGHLHRHAALHLRQRELYGGINFVSVAVGIFGVAEILRNLESERPAPSSIKHGQEPLAHPGGLPPDHRPGAARHGARRRAGHTARRRARPRIVRLLLRREARLEAARRRSGRAPSRALPGPESANNAAAQTSFIPLLTLGLPAHPSWR